jgi:hypothetical protein
LAPQQFFRLQPLLGVLGLSKPNTNRVTLSWFGPSVLQFSTNSLAGPWFDLPPASSPYTETIDSRQKFFRLRN